MRFVWLISAVGVMAAGCSLPGQKADFRSPDPQERTLAVGQAVKERDGGSITGLISLLESDDPAERMLAIRTLEQRTGQTLGYDYAASAASRREAVDRWVAWQRGGGAAPVSAVRTAR